MVKGSKGGKERRVREGYRDKIEGGRREVGMDEGGREIGIKGERERERR